MSVESNSIKAFFEAAKKDAGQSFILDILALFVFTLTFARVLSRRGGIRIRSPGGIYRTSIFAENYCHTGHGAGGDLSKCVSVLLLAGVGLAQYRV
ncbi:hypothetical protein ACFL9U_10480 [Thermodesulfobacteriota bacterium]